MLIAQGVNKVLTVC